MKSIRPHCVNPYCHSDKKWEGNALIFLSYHHSSRRSQSGFVRCQPLLLAASSAGGRKKESEIEIKRARKGE